MYQIDFFSHIAKLFSFGRGSFVVLSATGHAGAPRVHTTQVWAPADLHGACSRRSNSRRNWHVTTGSVSDDLEPTNPIETRNNFRNFKEHRQI